MMEARPYQANGYQAMRSTIAQGVRKLVLQSPTGSGKTFLSSMIGNGALRKGNRLAFVVPSIGLVDQTVESFYEEGIKDVGVIQADHHMTDWSKPIQVCSIQTIDKRGEYPQAAVVVLDECHVLFKRHKLWMTDHAWRNVPFIGLSATPWTKGLGRFFESLLVIATTRELIEQKYLCDFRVFATGHPDLKQVRKVRKEGIEDYHEGDLSEAMQKGSLTADIVRTWQQRWGKDKTLCFAVDRAHAQSLQARFKFAGVNFGYQDAETPQADRAALKRAFHNGEIAGVVSVGTLTHGIDWDVRCLSLARPTRSEILYVQIIGRALRLADGKEYAMILDHSDSTQRLGFVTDIHHDHLSTGKPNESAGEIKKRVPLPQECKGCGMLNPTRFRICPNCGAPIVIQSGVLENDGELFEVDRHAPIKSAKKAAARVWTWEEKAAFYSELKAYAIDRGYKAGWAAQKYKTRIGAWPDNAMRDVQPSPFISPGVMQWLRSQQIAWAKSKRRNGEAAQDRKPITYRDMADAG